MDLFITKLNREVSPSDCISSTFNLVDLRSYIFCSLIIKLGDEAGAPP